MGGGGRGNQGLGFWQLLELFSGNLLVSLLTLKRLPILHAHQNLCEYRSLYVMFRPVQLSLCRSTWECSKRFRQLCRDTHFDIWESLSPCCITNVIRHPWQRDRNCGTWMDGSAFKPQQPGGRAIYHSVLCRVSTAPGAESEPREPVIRGRSHKGNVTSSTQGLLPDEDCHRVLPLRLSLTRIWWMWGRELNWERLKKAGWCALGGRATPYHTEMSKCTAMAHWQKGRCSSNTMMESGSWLCHFLVDKMIPTYSIKMIVIASVTFLCWQNTPRDTISEEKRLILALPYRRFSASFTASWLHCCL